MFGTYSHPDDVLYFDTAEVFSNNSSSSAYWVISNNTASYLVSAKAEYGAWEYVHSSDEDAYPHSGAADGYEYEYLGQPYPPKAGSGGTGTCSVLSVNGKTGDVKLTAGDIDAIQSPATATVGQIVRVKAVDDAGKPTEWEAFDGVQDVTVCGNSIVDAGVASIPRASSSEYGVIKPITVYGVEVNNNGALMATARTAENYNSFPSAGFISKGTLENIINRLVKAAMCDGTGAAWTDAERIAALLRMGCTVDDNGFVKWAAQEATQ